jgi:hypothetical protein
MAREMRDRKVVDSELRLVAAVRLAIRELGGPVPSSIAMDALLDERLAHRMDAGRLGVAAPHLPGNVEQCH